MKEFNTTAVCIPSQHYMVDITDRVKEIKKMVDDGKYFTINRARQYGIPSKYYDEFVGLNERDEERVNSIYNIPIDVGI